MLAAPCLGLARLLLPAAVSRLERGPNRAPWPAAGLPFASSIRILYFLAPRRPPAAPLAPCPVSGPCLPPVLPRRSPKEAERGADGGTRCRHPPEVSATRAICYSSYLLLELSAIRAICYPS